MKKLQKLFSALLSLALIVSLVPLTAFAKDDGTKGRNPNPKPRCTVTITYKLGNEGKNTALISGLLRGLPLLAERGDFLLVGVVHDCVIVCHRVTSSLDREEGTPPRPAASPVSILIYVPEAAAASRGR